MRKHFYSDDYGLFQNNYVLIHQTWGLTEWFDEDDHDVNHYHSLDLKPTEHLWKILEWHVRQRSPLHSPKDHLREYLSDEWCISPVYFQIHVESMPRHHQTVLAPHGVLTSYWDTSCYFHIIHRYINLALLIKCESVLVSKEQDTRIILWREGWQHENQKDVCC